MNSTIVLIAIGLALLYLGWLATLWRFQERIVFQPPAGVPASQVPARRMSYRASDDTELFAYIVGDCPPGTTVVLAFHGNADISRWLVPWAITLAQATGSCVVLPEYRGYDGLAGSPSYESSKRDALAALELVRTTLGAPRGDTIYFGHSLGTAVATELATVETPRALVLQSPFSSARDMARRMVIPGVTVLWGIMSRVHFDTTTCVRTLACPVWVTHGDADMVIPVRMGRDVFAAAVHKGELLIVRGAGHNNLPEVGGREYWSWLRRAIVGEEARPTTLSAPAGTQSAP
ncbi:MAG TPA: alpha/beta hydrolase [Gemmatimonadaceae bacterium]